MTVEFRKDLFADERDDDLVEVGKPTRRQDILGHVTGRSPFYDDHLFEGLLHMRCVRSPHHHARIRSIDTSRAERMPGVVRVLTGADVPNNLNTLLGLMDFGRDDEPLLSTRKVAYRGEPVAAVIADSEARANDAVAEVRVSWEELPCVFDVEEALAPGAPVVNETYPNNSFDYHDTYDHQKLRFGDVESALASADRVIEGCYEMSPIEQAPIETNGAIAAPETNGRFVCYTSTQALFFSLATASKLLDLSSNRLHFVGGTVGGGFGGKVDSIVEPMALLGCMLTGRPVRFAWDRAEEMQVGAPRGAERWYLTDGVMNDGRIVARRFTGYFDAGAYTRLSSYAIIKATGHLPGPYTIPNVSSDILCVFTNRTPATAMRGFGITGVDFAIESHMDVVAHEIGMDPVELRILNAYRDGDMKPHRRTAKNCALIECAQVAAQKAGWPIGDAFGAMASTRDGGGERAAIPPTVTDRDGRIGERRAGRSGRGERRTIPPTPGQDTAAAGTPAASGTPARSGDAANYAHPAAAPAWQPGTVPQPPRTEEPPPRTEGPPPAPRTPAPTRYSRFATNAGLRRR